MSYAANRSKIVQLLSAVGLNPPLSARFQTPLLSDPSNGSISVVCVLWADSIAKVCRARFQRKNFR
jgi:hypothetical protein